MRSSYVTVGGITVLMSFQMTGGFLQSHGFAKCASRNGAVVSRESNCEFGDWSRRQVFGIVAGGLASPAVALEPEILKPDNGYRPAKRPTAYRVDSTQPPSLIPLSTAGKQINILKDLGKGSGTSKEMIVDDSVNLNNMLNRAVFGTISAAQSLASGNRDSSASGEGYATFVCLGLPSETGPPDIDLAVSLLEPMLQVRSGKSTALGLSFCPLSAQPTLDKFSIDGSTEFLINGLVEKGVPDSTVSMYLPLFKLAYEKRLNLLALATESEDVSTARREGLQNVAPERRAKYVPDPEGFIALSRDPRFQVYTDRSLLKDYAPLSSNDSPGGYFAERILIHETAASAAARYAVSRPDSMVVVVAKTPDLRFLQGINGRIPRVSGSLNPGRSKINDDAVTTILLNPTASDTLSRTRQLRLEIGTGPETLEYQTKLADYLWFSESPKVYMIPRLMNG